MKICKLNYLLVAFVSVIQISCSNADQLVPVRERGTLVSHTHVTTLTKPQVIEAISEFSAQDLVLYDVTLHTLTYQTEYDGAGIESRGLLLLPVGLSAPRLLAYFHGTLLPLKALIEKETPSLYKGGNTNFREVRTMGLSWASAGYAVFIPDYIGYGLTEGKDHPYVYYPEMFKSNIDGLLAAREFMNQQGMPDNKQLFITGWSQGGGACLSAHKYIQESYADRFTVAASSGLAGPYNINRFLKSVIEFPDRTRGITFIASWATYSINKFSGVKRPTDQIWTYPVPDQIAAMLPQSKIPGQVFKRVFISGINKGTDEAMIAALNRTSVHEGWKPVGRVFLHHGDKDSVVPYFNSTDAQNGLQAQGGDVTLYTYPNGDHDTELENFVRNTLKDFNAIQ